MLAVPLDYICAACCHGCRLFHRHWRCVWLDPSPRHSRGEYAQSSWPGCCGHRGRPFRRGHPGSGHLTGPVIDTHAHLRTSQTNGLQRKRRSLVPPRYAASRGNVRLLHVVSALRVQLPPSAGLSVRSCRSPPFRRRLRCFGKADGPWVSVREPTEPLCRGDGTGGRRAGVGFGCPGSSLGCCGVWLHDAGQCGDPTTPAEP